MTDLMHSKDSTVTDTATHRPLAEDVYIEPHGVSGVEGAIHGAIRREIRELGFDTALWLAKPSRQLDLHAAFLATVVVDTDGEYDLAVQCSGSFELRIDGDVVVSGPLRYSPALPEFHTQRVRLSAGTHVIAVHAHGEGLTMRMAAAVPSFIWVELGRNGELLPLQWRGRELDEYLATGLRVSVLLGWVEWQSRPWTQSWWREDATTWMPAVHVDLAGTLGPTTPSELPLRQWPRHIPELVSTGSYRDTFPGYELDDIATQFLLADDDPNPADDLDGTWWRYDLGRIRIGAMTFTVETTEPATVTIAYAERLTPDGRPSPVVALSAGSTRMMQHFAVSAGRSEIAPLQSLGGRFVEIRVRSAVPVAVSDEIFVEREMLGEPTGRFRSDDELLNQIWSTGIETLRASAEDSLVDSVRERGEWVGDVVSSALHILGAGWGDYRLVRRALLHAAAGARSDGLVAGCGPGEIIYLGTYAAQWVTACLEVATAEGTLDILRELEEPASANISALVGLIRDDGSHALPWSFVDWGYSSNPGDVDLAVVAHAYRAVRSWISWRSLLGKTDNARWHTEANRLRKMLAAGLLGATDPYHSLTLAAASGVISPEAASTALFDHIENGFPVNPLAPRLRDPSQVSRSSVTPYFTNYSAAVLLEGPDGARVADIWRKGWGWMIARGATTWWEVFDERWSQCHYWSGAPTWQMSRFGLGLHAVLDEEGSRVRLRVNDLGLSRLSGATHLPRDAFAEVAWTRDRDRITYQITLSAATTIERGGSRVALCAGAHEFVLSRIGESSQFE